MWSRFTYCNHKLWMNYLRQCLDATFILVALETTKLGENSQIVQALVLSSVEKGVYHLNIMVCRPETHQDTPKGPRKSSYSFSNLTPAHPSHEVSPNLSLSMMRVCSVVHGPAHKRTHAPCPGAQPGPLRFWPPSVNTAPYGALDSG